MSIEEYGYRTECIGIKEFPPFIRVTLGHTARTELFSQAMAKMRKIRKKYELSEDVFDILYGKKKGYIIKLLSEHPQPARTLIKASGLSPSAVYHFLSYLKKRHIISKKGCMYYLEEYDSDSLFLDEIVKIEEDPSLRRKYGISIKELELAYFLWDTFSEVTPGNGGYGRTYSSEYTLADAVHRWKTGRTDTPVWALKQLMNIAEYDLAQKAGSIVQYHLPPGTSVNPHYDSEYKLPIRADSVLDRIVIQLMHKMSRNHLYTFPKRMKWLFENLHHRFGEFDDSTSRIPSAVIEILKSYYDLKSMRRSSACIPPCVEARWSELTPLSKVKEVSSLLLHIISLSSRSDCGFEITSRSRTFLEEISHLVSDLGVGTLTVRKKHKRPHFRVYLSESKVAALRRYTHIFQEYPDLEIWSRIPLNRIAENLASTNGGCESVEDVCRGELSLFVESILRSLERRKREFHERLDYQQYREDITNYFWQQKLIPSPRRVAELVDMHVNEEENIIYA
jgi:hypothetical protein